MTPHESSLVAIADKWLSKKRAVALIPPVVVRAARNSRQVQWSQWDRRPEARQWLTCKEIGGFLKCTDTAVYRHFYDNRQLYASRKIAVGNLRVLEIRRRGK